MEALATLGCEGRDVAGMNKGLLFLVRKRRELLVERSDFGRGEVWVLCSEVTGIDSRPIRIVSNDAA